MGSCVPASCLDSYHLLGEVATAPKGKTGLFAPELEHLFCIDSAFREHSGGSFGFQNESTQPVT